MMMKNVTESATELLEQLSAEKWFHNIPQFILLDKNRDVGHVFLGRDCKWRDYGGTFCTNKFSLCSSIPAFIISFVQCNNLPKII